MAQFFGGFIALVVMAMGLHWLIERYYFILEVISWIGLGCAAIAVLGWIFELDRIRQYESAWEFFGFIGVVTTIALWLSTWALGHKEASEPVKPQLQTQTVRR